jgi:predicted DNA-binding ribbon-helix-helix protein
MMADYILKGIDDQLWREVKAIAALQGMTVKDLIIKLLEKETRKLKK